MNSKSDLKPGKLPLPGPSTSTRTAIKRPLPNVIHPEGSEQQENKKIKPTVTNKIHPIQIYSGSIPQIVHVFKANPSLNILYETYGRILSISQGRHQCEQIILLRSFEGTGPVIQGFFYEIDLSLSPACRNSQLIRCMGRFTGQNRFQIIKIGPTNQAFIDSMDRLNSFSDFGILRV